MLATQTNVRPIQPSLRTARVKKADGGRRVLSGATGGYFTWTKRGGGHSIANGYVRGQAREGVEGVGNIGVAARGLPLLTPGWRTDKYGEQWLGMSEKRRKKGNRWVLRV